MGRARVRREASQPASRVAGHVSVCLSACPPARLSVVSYVCMYAHPSIAIGKIPNGRTGFAFLTFLPRLARRT